MSVNAKMTAIADAIRGKTGGTQALTLDQMAQEIAGIESGGVSEHELLETYVSGTWPTGDIVVNSTGLISRAFAAKPITSAEFPNFSDRIPTYLFENCKSLVTVKMPNTTETSVQAFTGCSALINVELDSLIYLQNNCFVNCTALQKMDLPKVKSIANGAFSGSSKFSTLILRNTALVTLGNTGAFTNTPFASGGAGGTVYVPSALISEYQAATNWSTLYAAGTCNFVAIEGSEYE